ncbi:class I adenylate-forming enzyme family protein [Streptomyces longispororuber]|uniref:class I adenylate-forming enzyme family protein n=1 Tax=Streptomyces longispororuber TaxID=68230 RepID=UPI0036FF523C
MTGLLIGEVVRSAAEAAPRRTALVRGGSALTFAELDAACDRAARHLAARGVRRGDRVACPARSLAAALPAYVGAARAGAVFVPLERATALARPPGAVTPCLVLTEAELAEVCPALAPAPATARAPAPGHAPAREGRPRAATTPPGPAPEEGGPEAGDPEEGDPHLLLFTGPGRTRGAVVSQRAGALRAHCGVRPEPPGALVCGLPLGHWGAWTAVLRQWQARGTVVLPEEEGPAAVCAAVREHRAARLLGTPRVWEGVLDTAPHHLAALRCADVETAEPGAAPPRLLEAIRTATPGARVRAFFATPETGDLTTWEHADVRARPGTCGTPVPGVRVRLARGELWVRGPLLFDGYVRDKRATDAALRDGWYRTGRAARRDEDGYLYLTGRRRAERERAAAPSP